MSKRIKIDIPKLEGRPAVEETLQQLGGLQNERNQIALSMDKQKRDIDERYGDALQKLDDHIQRKALILEAWAQANPDEFPNGRKSIAMQNGTIGFRSGTPKVVNSGRKYRTLKLLAEAMVSTPWARRFVKRAAPTVNREALIASRDKLTAAQLAAFGISIVQEEQFFAEPNAEALEQGTRVA